MQCNHKRQLQRLCRPRLQQHRWLLRWKFKLVKPSEGDQGGQKKTKAHYTISTVDSCPEVAVYAGKCLAALGSGAAVSLIHLQAYKLMPDTLKTAITLPRKLEYRSRTSLLTQSPRHSSDTTCPDTYAPSSYYRIMAQNSRIRPLTESQRISVLKGYSLHHTTLKVMGK